LTDIRKESTLFEKDTIDKWNQRINISSGQIFNKQFKSMNKPISEQIDTLLMDKDRSIKKSQLKRYPYKEFGNFNLSTKQNGTNENIEKHDKHLKDLDPEIYDDTDFYQQLLKEILESNSENQTVINRPQRINKRKYTNQNKLKYDVHEKLVGFVTPTVNVSTMDWNFEELSEAIFGGQQNK